MPDNDKILEPVEGYRQLLDRLFYEMDILRAQELILMPDPKAFLPDREMLKVRGMRRRRHLLCEIVKPHLAMAASLGIDLPANVPHPRVFTIARRQLSNQKPEHAKRRAQSHEQQDEVYIPGSREVNEPPVNELMR